MNIISEASLTGAVLWQPCPWIQVGWPGSPGKPVCLPSRRPPFQGTKWPFLVVSYFSLPPGKTALDLSEIIDEF